MAGCTASLSRIVLHEDLGQGHRCSTAHSTVVTNISHLTGIAVAAVYPLFSQHHSPAEASLLFHKSALIHHCYVAVNSVLLPS